MPSATRPAPGRGMTKFTNCRLVVGDELVWDDMWVSAATGKILRGQAAFYDELVLPDQTVDLGGRIVSPGLIECQLNGAFGFNFSTVLDDMSQYAKDVRDLSRKLLAAGVTSYVPTVTSQTSELYKKVLPFLGPSGHTRRPGDGAESLGAHCEGPFLNRTKNGIHNVEVLRTASSFADLEDVYGASNMDPSAAASAGHASAPVRMITVAPELGAMTAVIPSLVARGIRVAVGHTEATYEEASAAVAAGASMITHLFNAMRPLHHRDPGVFGVLGRAEAAPRPFFGVIADGIHLHPTTVKIAWAAHPDGLVLVTDAMHMAGLPDGVYRWTNGDGDHYISKRGAVLRLEGTDKIAGSSITLIECVNNFLHWSGASIPRALKAVTSTPAAMLGVSDAKGSLKPGADADLVVFSEHTDKHGSMSLVVDEVWKFGTKVFEKEDGQQDA